MAPSFDNPNSSSSRATTTANKRRKLTVNHHQPLIPGLPDHIAQLCLNLVPPSTLNSVCHSWRRVIYTRSFPPFFAIYALLSDHDSTLKLSCYDPISSKWSDVTSSSQYLRRVCIRHPSFIARNLPAQSITFDGKLVLLAGTSGDLSPAFSQPPIFDPLTKMWSCGPQLTNPRRWCAAGASHAAVVVASGIGSHYAQTVARSVDKWVFPETNLFDKKSEYANGVWMEMNSLRDVKFSREAIDGVGVNGKLYMVNGKEGAVYDVVSDEWSEMPVEMLGGWCGPAAAMDEKVLYMVDDTKGVLRKYDDVMKVWVDVLIDERLKGAEHIAAGGGRVCVVCGGAGIVVVDVEAATPRVWVVDTPAGDQALRVHILPRMCSLEF